MLEIFTMSPEWKTILWHQFGAAIKTLENALSGCPDALWQAQLWHDAKSRPVFAEFWYITYHTIFWIDFYVSDSAETYAPPPPFTHSETDFDENPPQRVYTKQELQTYLDYARAKCRAKIESITDENEPQRIRENWRVKTVAELMIYTTRHVQEHAAQLNMLLGQKAGSAPGWVGQAN